MNVISIEEKQLYANKVKLGVVFKRKILLLGCTFGELCCWGVTYIFVLLGCKVHLISS